MTKDKQRTWIVTISCRAAFRFDENQRISLRASPQTTVPLTGVRLRNENCWATQDHSPTGPQFVGAFVAEAAGDFATAEDAVDFLANFATPYFHVMALITNAGVNEPEDLVAYAVPCIETKGEFVIQRHSQARAPAARVRKVSAQDAMEVIALLIGHPHQRKLHQAMSHYRAALNHLDPLNRVLSAESLWMTVENLYHVILDQLRKQHGLPLTKDGKHQLALQLGFQPRKLEQRSLLIRTLIRLGLLDASELKRDNSHLDQLDRHIRLDLVLGGDKECYQQLKDMSDGFEHGYMRFGEVQKKSKVADRAFTHLRRAILREMGLQPSSPLFSDRFDDPLGVWRPIFEARGSYTDTAADAKPVTPEHFNDDWPDPPGLSMVPMVKAIIDRPDGTRDVTLEVNGATHAMTATQAASISETRWLSPSGRDGKILRSEITQRLNGEIVEVKVEVPPPG
jgi:hypothetical protein